MKAVRNPRILRAIPLMVVTAWLSWAQIVWAIANPAAVFCEQLGYEHQVRTGSDGGQFGVCVFGDGSECDAWAFYRKCNSPATCDGDCDCPWPCPVRIIYVDDDATGTNDGTSWPDAYIYLQDALVDANSAEKPVEIRVAEGIYTPDEGGGSTQGDREATFQLISDVTLKGGYAGFGQADFGEVDPNTRDIEAYAAVLSGDLSGDDVDVNDPEEIEGEPTRSDNSDRVVTGSGTDGTAVLDGFTISGGNARHGGGRCTMRSAARPWRTAHSVGTTEVGCATAKATRRSPTAHSRGTCAVCIT